MADEVMLLDFWSCPFGIRVRLALAEKGVVYEYREENLSDKSSILLKSNPIHKKIPVLIHNGRSICESLIIVEYIDEVWKTNSPLLPEDYFERATTRFWANYIDTKVYQCSQRIWMGKGAAKDGAKELIDHLKLLESALGEKNFFGGETFGLVDIALVAFSCWFDHFDKYEDLNIKEECPKLTAWLLRCKERESVAKTLPDLQKLHGYVCLMKKKSGLE